MFTYAQYVQANEALFTCMEGVKPKKFDGLSPFEKTEVCKTEKATVEGFLKNGSLSFTSLIDERLNALKA